MGRARTRKRPFASVPVPHPSLVSTRGGAVLPDVFQMAREADPDESGHSSRYPHLPLNRQLGR